MRVEDMKGINKKTKKYQGTWQNKREIYDKRVRGITIRRLNIPEIYKGKKVLILGDAFGVESVELIKRGFEDLTCTVADKREIYGDNFHVCDIHDLPFNDEEFDFVYASHILEHAIAPMLALEEIRRVMKPGAQGLFWMPYHDKGQSLPYHFSCFRPHVWRDLIKKAKLTLTDEGEHKDRLEKGYFVRK